MRPSAMGSSAAYWRHRPRRAPLLRDPSGLAPALGARPRLAVTWASPASPPVAPSNQRARPPGLPPPHQRTHPPRLPPPHQRMHPPRLPPTTSMHSCRSSALPARAPTHPSPRGRDFTGSVADSAPRGHQGPRGEPSPQEVAAQQQRTRAREQHDGTLTGPLLAGALGPGRP